MAGAVKIGRIGWEMTRSFKAMFAKFINHLALGNEKLTFLEVGASTGGILRGLLGKAGKRVVNPEKLRVSI